MHLAIKYHIYYIDILSPKKKIPVFLLLFFFSILCQNIAEILLKLVLNTNQSINKSFFNFYLGYTGQESGLIFTSVCPNMAINLWGRH